MPEGYCRWFNESKGYGFLRSDDEKDFFVHFKNIEGSGFKTLTTNQRVTFDVETGIRGDYAVKVKVIP